MSEKRKYRIIVGVFVTLAGLFMAASLLSYNPHNGPMPDYTAADGASRNICGIAGSWLASYSITLFGWVSGLASLAIILCGVFLVTGLPRQRWSGKIVGIILALVAGTLTLGLPHIGSDAAWNASTPSSGLLGVSFTRWVYWSVGWAGTLGLIGVGTVGALFLLAAKPLSLLITAIPDWISGLVNRVKNASLPFNTATATASTGNKTTQTKTPPSAQSSADTSPSPTSSPPPTEENPPMPSSPPPSADTASEDTAEGDANSPEPEIVARQDSDPTDESGYGKVMKKRSEVVDFQEQNYELPSLDILAAPETHSDAENAEKLRKRGRLLEKTLDEFNIDANVVRVQRGPVVTMYEMALAAGTKVSKVENLDDDMAIALKAPNVRIVAPIPGKSTVGIEVPNANREIVRLRELLGPMDEETADMAVPLFLGKDPAGNSLIVDLAKAPHLLIAGATGSGKSVCLNSIISSILMTRTPLECQLLLMDPKSVEFSDYKDLPHLICPILTDMKKAAGVLKWACKKMDERFSMLGQVNVRNIHEYNKLGKEQILRRLDVEDDAEVDDVPFFMPHTVIVVDELGELMMVAAKDVESSIIRLSQKARAVGIHLICATQRPSADVITGLIKANLPARIAFQVSSKVNSRVILDRNGAELLLGSGDMLMQPPATSSLVRAQGTFVSQQETQKLVDTLSEQAEPHFKEELRNLNAASDPQDHDDELYEEAVRIVLETQRGSVSLLQRRLAIGYTRAARLIDMMAEAGIVGSHRGSKAREVMLTLDEWEEARDNA
ncbi:MAG: DNA translocase FtsK 4TM domain-containing protein [Planctomycetota bacterium]